MKIKPVIPKYDPETDKLSPLLETLRHADNELGVPENYFESLSPGIIDMINEKEVSKSQWGITVFFKPAVWIPIIAVATAALLLMLVIPSKNDTTIPAYNELADISMAYDASYAEEVLFAESYKNDQKIEIAVNSIPVTTAAISQTNDLSDDEIEEYLKDQDLELDIITEY